MTRWFALLGASVVGLAVPVYPSPSRDASFPVNRDCGAYCVGIVLHLHGYEVPKLDDLRLEARVDHDGVTSMFNVAQALRDHGLTVAGVTLPSATPRSGTYVAHLTRSFSGFPLDHFVVIVPRSAELVTLVSSPFWVEDVSWERIRPRLGDIMLRVDRPWNAHKVIGSALLLVGIAAVIALTMQTLRRKRTMCRRHS